MPDFIFRVRREGTILDRTSGVHGKRVQVSPDRVGTNIAEALPGEIGDVVTAFLDKGLEFGDRHRSSGTGTELHIT